MEKRDALVDAHEVRFMLCMYVVTGMSASRAGPINGFRFAQANEVETSKSFMGKTPLVHGRMCGLVSSFLFSVHFGTFGATAVRDVM